MELGLDPQNNLFLKMDDVMELGIDGFGSQFYKKYVRDFNKTK